MSRSRKPNPPQGLPLAPGSTQLTLGQLGRGEVAVTSTGLLVRVTGYPNGSQYGRYATPGSWPLRWGPLVALPSTAPVVRLASTCSATLAATDTGTSYMGMSYRGVITSPCGR
jgi:hypothetical protein